jgi:hypothetical protein
MHRHDYVIPKFAYYPVLFAWPVLGFQKTECPLGWGILFSNTAPTFLLSPWIPGRYHRKERKKLRSGLYAS